jgi:hypothetical protein
VNTQKRCRSRYILIILAVTLALVLIVTAVNIAVPVSALLILASVFLHLPPPARSQYLLQIAGSPTSSRAPPALVV